MSECWCQIFSPSPPFNLISGVTQTSRGWIDLHEELTNLCWQSVATLLSDITEPSHVPSWGTTTHATFPHQCNFKTLRLVTRCESTSSVSCQSCQSTDYCLITTQIQHTDLQQTYGGKIRGSGQNFYILLTLFFHCDTETNNHGRTKYIEWKWNMYVMSTSLSSLSHV